MGIHLLILLQEIPFCSSYGGPSKRPPQRAFGGEEALREGPDRVSKTSFSPFLRAIKSDGGSSGGGGGGSSYVNHHAATKMVKTARFNGGGPPKVRPSAFLPDEYSPEFNDGNNYFLLPWSCKDSSVVNINGGNPKIVPGFLAKNSFPPKELSLVASFGDHHYHHHHAEEDAKGTLMSMGSIWIRSWI